MNKRIDQYIFAYEETNFSSSYSEDDSDTDSDLIDEIKALIVNLSILSLISDNLSNVEIFITSFDLVEKANAEIMITNLANRSLSHFLINNQTADDLQTDLKIAHSSNLIHICMKDIDFFTYIIIDRYTSKMFYDIMIDSKASVQLIVDYKQYLAFIKNISIELDSIKVETINVQFEIESTFSIESFTIDISFELVKFHVMKADTFFLLSLADMNRLKVYFNNVENLLVDKIKILSIIRRFDHGFLLWNNSYCLHLYIVQSFNFNFCYLTDVELRQLHKRFDHSFITKLHNLLKRFDHEMKKAVLKKLIKFCTFCQKYAKSSERFKFILKNDVNFNYSVIVDVMYIENHFILHVVDEIIRFQAAKWLQNISAKHIWDMLCLCWIDVYLNLSDHILTDADKNFANRKFRQFVISMTIIIKAMLVEAHWSIDVVKRYHAELRRAYQMIFKNLESTISKEIILQMIVKAINDTVDSDELILILLIFETYSRMHVMNLSISLITHRAIVIKKAMIEIKKFRVERQIVDVLNTRNESIIISIHDLSLNSDVLVWRKSNVNQRDKWIESFKLLDIEDETCKIVLSSESIDFRSIVIKSFLIESINDVESTNEIQSISDIEDIQSSDHQHNSSTETLEITRSFAILKSTRARRLSLRYQNFADIIIFLQDDDSFSNQLENSNQFENSLTSIFVESRRNEINDLLKKRVYELIIIDAVFRNVRIFNFRFLDEIKHSDIADVYEKFRLMIQTYNDHDKTLMLIQSFTIQRMSQRIILALTACVISNCHLYLRNITQAYVQSKISFNRQFFIRSSFKLDLSKNSILRVVKSLYDVLETETHWFHTYQKHHKKRLSIIESTFDSCLLHICQINQIEFIDFIIQSIFINHFEVVNLQTDDTLILVDDEFVALEENELARVRLTFKKREKLNLIISIKFNDELIILVNDDNVLLLTQSKQFDQIRLIDVKISLDLTSSRDEIRKLITLKDQYVAQRAKEVYIVIVSQFETSFDFSFDAQVINSKKKDAKRLNQQLQWQLNNSTKELRFVFLNCNKLRLMIFIDAAFVNTSNLHSQID